MVGVEVVDGHQQRAGRIVSQRDGHGTTAQCREAREGKGQDGKSDP
jgi:hypothetical protein